MTPENVGDYPRPAICEPVSDTLAIQFNGVEIARSEGGFRALETYHPPTYYLPLAAFAEGVLVPNGRRTICEWKGQATYFDVVVGDRQAEAAAWTYRQPTPTFRDLLGHVAVYAEPMDACFVSGVKVIPQPGNFYGGWVTPNITGPIKGAPGTTHW